KSLPLVQAGPCRAAGRRLVHSHPGRRLRRRQTPTRRPHARGAAAHTMTRTDTLRARLDALAAAAQTGADALARAPLDLADGTLAELLVELESLDGRLALVLDRLASTADPVGLMANDAASTRSGQ